MPIDIKKSKKPKVEKSPTVKEVVKDSEVKKKKVAKQITLRTLLGGAYLIDDTPKPVGYLSMLVGLARSGKEVIPYVKEAEDVSFFNFLDSLESKIKQSPNSVVSSDKEGESAQHLEVDSLLKEDNSDASKNKSTSSEKKEDGDIEVEFL